MKSPASPRIRLEHAEFKLPGVWRSAALLSALSLVLVLGGCATATYSPVMGKPKPGKMGNRALVNSCFLLPIYSGPPNRPYAVVGIVHSASGSNITQAARVAVREANENGADALVLLDESVLRAGVRTTGTGFGLWNAYSRDFSDEELPCPDLGVSPSWRAYVDYFSAIYESEFVFAAIRWL